MAEEQVAAALAERPWGAARIGGCAPGLGHHRNERESLQQGRAASCSSHCSTELVLFTLIHKCMLFSINT